MDRFNNINNFSHQTSISFQDYKLKGISVW